MANLTLYSDARLPCPQRVLITAAHLGIKLNIINVDITKNEHKTPEFTALNPFHAIPVLIDNSISPPFVLRESRAICRYLCLLHSSTSDPSKLCNAALVPNIKDPLAIARFEEAACCEVTGFDPVANKYVLEVYFKPHFGLGGEVDEVLVKELWGRLGSVLDAMESMLGMGDGMKFMAGEEFSLVDIFYVPYLSKLVTINEKVLEGRKNLRAWWERVAGTVALAFRD